MCIIYVCMYIYIYIYIHIEVVIVRLKQVQLSFECNKIDAFFEHANFPHKISEIL